MDDAILSMNGCGISSKGDTARLMILLESLLSLLLKNYFFLSTSKDKSYI